MGHTVYVGSATPKEPHELTKHQEASNLTFPVVPAIVFGLAWFWIQMCRHRAVFPGFRIHFNACPDFDPAASDSRLGQEDLEKKKIETQCNFVLSQHLSIGPFATSKSRRLPSLIPGSTQYSWLWCRRQVTGPPDPPQDERASVFPFVLCNVHTSRDNQQVDQQTRRGPLISRGDRTGLGQLEKNQ